MVGTWLLFFFVLLGSPAIAKTEVFHGELHTILLDDNQLLILMDSIASQDGVVDLILRIELAEPVSGFAERYSPRSRILLADHLVELTLDFDLKGPSIFFVDRVFVENMGLDPREILMDRYTFEERKKKGAGFTRDAL